MKTSLLLTPGLLLIHVKPKPHPQMINATYYNVRYPILLNKKSTYIVICL